MTQFLSPENEAYIQGQLATGVFASRGEAMDAGVELLRKRDLLIGRLQESRSQLDRGDFNDYDDESLATRFDELKAKATEAAK